MTDHQVESLYDTEWIQTAYFSDPERRVTLEAGEVLMEPGDFNNRLYYIVSGAITGFRSGSQSEEPLELFRLKAGTYLGLHSFFSRHYASYAEVIASQRSTLAWIDSQTEPVEPARFGSLADQFMPVIVGELYQRQMRILDAAEDRAKTVQRLYQAEKMTTLGQLAAGLAHELNNAIGVISRNTDQLTSFVDGELLGRTNCEQQWFAQGQERGQHASSQQVRKQTALYQTRFGLSRDEARQLARMAPDQAHLDRLGPHVVDHIERASRFWQAGRDSHDTQRAAKHAVSIVRSVKNLGRSDQQRDAKVSLKSTLEEALSLLHSDLRQVEIRLKYAETCKVTGNASELVQVWVNLIKNACDALQGTGQERRELRISTHQQGACCRVSVSDNGPGIPAELQERIFEPSFTTKKTGLSFGLGLGLSIVARIVESHHGTIRVSSTAGDTRFEVLLPCACTQAADETRQTTEE